ncbi:carbohydrate kinase family protein [Parasediminibacterium sp. JCM 36343]|uniref:carbohydrate kinase family protein n=1 Tax=Parasediminibacterium sp. JCM 36343 TaxID=3374279 RepID=UPI003978AB29
MQPYILAIGELLIDGISTESIDNLSQAKTFDIHIGGSAANFSIFLNRSNVTTKLVASIGADSFGNRILHELSKENNVTEFVYQQSGHATSLIMVAKTKGTPDFIPYRDADKLIQPVDSTLLNNAVIVHSTAFALSQQPAQDSILKAFEKAAQQHIPISIDWNYSEKIWGRNNDAREIFQRLQSCQPMLKFSLDDINRFVGKPMSIENAKAYLQTIQATAICLTCGSEGVFYKTYKSGWGHIPAQKNILVKDATGAGDAFWAGFITGWQRNYDMDKCVSNGVETASKKLQGML